MTVGAFSQVEESEQTGSAAARACGSFKRHGPVATPDANEEADVSIVSSTHPHNPIAALTQSGAAAAGDEQQRKVEAEFEAEVAAATASSPTAKSSTYGGAEASGAAAGAAPERTARTSVVSIPCISFTSEAQAQAQAQEKAHEEALAAERKGSVQSSESESAGASDRRIIVGRLNTAVVMPRVRKLSSSGLENPFFRQAPAAAAASASASTSAFGSASSGVSVVSSFIAAAAASANESLLRLEASCTQPKSSCAHTALVSAAQKERLSAISRETDAQPVADAQHRHSFGIGAHAGEQKADKRRAAAGGLSLASAAAAAAEPGGYPSAPPPTPTLKTIVALATSGRSSDAKERGKGKTGTDYCNVDSLVSGFAS